MRGLGALVVFSLFAASGCGGSGLVKVKGLVTLDGQPLEGVTVVFVPANENVLSAAGITDKSGQFSLMTRKPGDGVAPGEYRVTLCKKEGGSQMPTPGNITDAKSAEEFRKQIHQAKAKATSTLKFVTPIDYADQNKTPFTGVNVPGGSYQFDLQSSFKYHR